MAQLRATVLRAAGHSEIQLKENLWRHQHEWAGENMYKLAVDMRGFYLKVNSLAQVQAAGMEACHGRTATGRLSQDGSTL